MGGRNPERVMNRAAKVRADFLAGDEIGAMCSFDVGDWWMSAMAAHLPAEMVSRLREMKGILDPHRKFLDDIAHEIARDSLPDRHDILDIEMSWPAWTAAACVLLDGGNEDAAFKAAESAVTFA